MAPTSLKPCLGALALAFMLAAQAPAEARGFDNLRFGLTQFEDPAIASRFGGRGAMLLGFDYDMGGGWAFGVDTHNVYHDQGPIGQFMSITPLLAKYRMGVSLGRPDFVPFATVGAGPTLVATAIDAGPPSLGIGLGAALGLGVMLQQALTVEVTAGLGRIGQQPYQGLQLRLGTAFGSLGRMPGR